MAVIDECGALASHVPELVLGWKDSAPPAPAMQLLCVQ